MSSRVTMSLTQLRMALLEKKAVVTDSLRMTASIARNHFVVLSIDSNRHSPPASWRTSSRYWRSSGSSMKQAKCTGPRFAKCLSKACERILSPLFGGNGKRWHSNSEPPLMGTLRSDRHDRRGSSENPSAVERAVHACAQG